MKTLSTFSAVVAALISVGNAQVIPQQQKTKISDASRKMTVETASSDVAEAPVIISGQDPATLALRPLGDATSVNRVFVSGQASDIQRQLKEISSAATAADCGTSGDSLEVRIKAEPAKLLEIIEAEISANPGCACEITKSAILSTEADAKTVTAIVETGILASPENMRIISQCAIATAPDAVSDVQALLAKLEPNGGDTADSAKSAKSAKGEVAAPKAPSPFDPLDRVDGVLGMTGSWRSYFNHGAIPFLPIPVIVPPPVTDVN